MSIYTTLPAPQAPQWSEILAECRLQITLPIRIDLSVFDQSSIQDEELIGLSIYSLYIFASADQTAQVNMDTLQKVLQIIVALGLLNVWLLRCSKKTTYRGKGAESMRGEFEAYGLPTWFMWLTGVLKIGVAVALLVGIWMPALVQPAALVLILLMLGAFGMHLKVKDPLKAAVPALVMLVMALAILAIALL